MTDNYSEEEFAPIAAELKKLPYFAPSSRFADNVMASVRIAGAARVPAVVASPRPVVQPDYSIERRAPYEVTRHDLRRSIPARIALAGFVATAGVTMALVTLVAAFNIDLMVLVSRVFGAGAVSFLTTLATDAAATATSTATGAAASAGTGAGAAVAGSFAAGLVAATVALRAAASASRRAA